VSIPSSSYGCSSLTVPWIATYEACLKRANNSGNACPCKGWLSGETPPAPILANAKGRAAFDTVITRPRTPDWDFGKPLQSWLKEAPPDWRGIDLDFGKPERDGHAEPIPHFDGVPNIRPMTLRLGVAALLTAPDLRVLIHDDRAGIKRLNVKDGNKPVTTVVDYAGFREKLAHHRSEKVNRYQASNGKTFNDDELLRRGVVVAIDDFIATQKSALPGLPGGPSLVPSPPVVSFENGHLSGRQDVLERIIHNNKAEPVTLQFSRPGSAFPTHKRPHMRRGHLHTVLHGVGRRERHVKWFPAVFVNADPTFVADARKYVVMP